MHAPKLEPEAPKERHLAVAPHRPGAGSSWLLAIVLAIAAAAVSGGYVYAWQHGKVDEGAALLSETEAQLGRAIGRIGILEDQTRALSARLEGLAANLDDVRAAKVRAEELLAGARWETRSLRGRLAEVRGEVARLLGRTERLRALAGAPLPEGTHVSRIVAVGAGQVPPRLVVKDAYHAPWHVVATVPAPSVTIYDRDTGLVDKEIRFGRFAKMFARPTRHDLETSRYWLTIEAGKVTAIGELVAVE